MPTLRQQGNVDYFKSLDPEEEEEIDSLTVVQLAQHPFVDGILAISLDVACITSVTTASLCV